MGIDPLAPMPTDPAAAVRQELADLKRRVAQGERGSRAIPRRVAVDNTELAQPGAGTDATKGPTLELLIPSGGAMVAWLVEAEMRRFVGAGTTSSAIIDLVRDGSTGVIITAASQGAGIYRYSASAPGTLGTDAGPGGLTVTLEPEGAHTYGLRYVTGVDGGYFRDRRLTALLLG